MVDTGVEFTATYSKADNSKVKAFYEINACKPRKFYRANTPAFFLNKELFGIDRVCMVKSDEWIAAEGLHLTSDYSAFFVGNALKTLGVVVEDIKCEVDGTISQGAHLLMLKHTINDEFILHINPLPAFKQSEAKQITCELIIGAWA